MAAAETLDVRSKYWVLAELWANAGLAPNAAASTCLIPILSIADDSRQVQPGSLFVAIRGEKMDGHSYVEAAAKAGASVIIVESEVSVRPGVLVIRVADTREVLARLAAAFHGLRWGDMRFIGVTGTNGKTTVSWMLRSILQATGQRAGMLGTIEYDLVSERRTASLTTPGSLDLCRSMATARTAGATYGVMEASSHALDQRRCDGLTFSAGIFTNLTSDHMDYHKTVDGYRQAKRRLFKMLDSDSAAVINADDLSADYMVQESSARVIRFGVYSANLDVQVRIEKSTRRGQSCVLRFGSSFVPVQLSLVGTHNALNAAAAAATADFLGIDRETIVTGLERLSRVPGRLQRVEPDGCPFTVLVDYAHTDDALLNVLQAVRTFTKRKVICVFGCGGDRDRTKRPRMGAVVSRWADFAVVTSDNPRSEDPEAIIDEIMPGFEQARSCPVRRQADRRLAIGEAISEARTGDTVLIAGKGHEDYQQINGQTIPFDDGEVARSFLLARSAAERVA